MRGFGGENRGGAVGGVIRVGVSDYDLVGIVCIIVTSDICRTPGNAGAASGIRGAFGNSTMPVVAPSKSGFHRPILSAMLSGNVSRRRAVHALSNADTFFIFAIRAFYLGCNRFTPEFGNVFHEIAAALLGAHEPFRDQLVVSRCDRCNADIEMLGKVAFGRQLRPAGDSAARDVLANGLV